MDFRRSRRTNDQTRKAWSRRARIPRRLGLADVEGGLIQAYRTIVISNRVKHVLAQAG